MIKSISIISNSINKNVVFDANQKQKMVIDLLNLDFSNTNSFDIKIEFNQSISQFRNHDYRWINCEKDRIANEFCPKIIKLKNGQLVQANIQLGIWEINKINSHVLLWRFNPEFSESITNYTGNANRKNISAVFKKFNFVENPSLLFPENHALEFSRSKYSFSAIACFTDHCDFDTLENLEVQREFFKKNQIIITKGFFLNHFSKRADNASFQSNKEELLKWIKDGHELCYHSLSQSIKNDDQSFQDYNQFLPPLNDLKVWIDHGYQPYNFSLLQKNRLSNEDFEKVLTDKNITTLWNYIDSGTATNGVINQLNPNQFTLESFLNGNKNLDFVKRLQLTIKNIIYHYYNDDQMILKYQNAAGNFKKVIFQKKIKFIFPFIKDFFNLSISIFSVLLSWKSSKSEPFKLAKYSPLVFKHIIDQKEFYIFQTLEMLDFQKSLSKNNIDTLIKEKGVFIAHTYFSVPMEYHTGRLISSYKTIDQKVFENFNLLGEKIKNKEIWNPTLSELIAYWSDFERLILDINQNGNVYEKTETILENRPLI
ncbi:hypothetical protein [Flavobacterium olei]|uniref:hypothetical protein n=1 Tax=Flavobacterium olei TaxID=1886782 RepID=UPI0032197483